MKRLGFTLFLFLLVFQGPVALAETREALFEKGNTAYMQDDFSQAVTYYGEILDQGWANSAVHYNLGNAYYKLGEKGQAIVHYERALRLDPLDSLTRENLSWVRLQLEDKITPRGVSWLSRKVDDFLELWSAEGTVRMASVLNVLFFLAAILALFWRSAQFILRKILWVVGPILLCVVIMAFAEIHRANIMDGIVMAKEVQVYYGPSEREQAAFTLHEGSACRIRSQVGGWMSIRLADGKTGWLLASAVEEI